MRKLEFTSLQVRDLEASKEFYISKLGFEASEFSNPGACIFKYKDGEASFAIRKPIGILTDGELGAGVSLWFAIDESIEDLYASFIEKNVTILGAINNTPFGQTLIAKDPDGYNVTFLKGN